MNHPAASQFDEKPAETARRAVGWLAAFLTGTTLIALTASAQTTLEYEQAVLDTLRYGECRYDNSADGAEMRFARQVAPKLGLTSVQITDRRSPHRRALREAVVRLEGRGLVASEGEVLHLVGCGG
ncbi:hypothetical protein [uncultured Jannaschia sp.]|uniref:hypothetical protein n=1 Tax=uncultured Jannaschia sp. TaxID=293347 RepID=UPI002631A63D|nr:hypothetical protein [uncultured Jannaschia sp.]